MVGLGELQNASLILSSILSQLNSELATVISHYVKRHSRDRDNLWIGYDRFSYKSEENLTLNLAL